MSNKKYKIQKDSVQETLIIPLYGRKLAMDMYLDLQTVFLSLWIRLKGVRLSKLHFRIKKVLTK